MVCRKSLSALFSSSLVFWISVSIRFSSRHKSLNGYANVDFGCYVYLMPLRVVTLILIHPYLKLVSAICYQMIFLPNDNPSKNMKNILIHLKSSFRSWDIQIFVIFSILFHTSQFQKGKWNNLWCHELACINLQM